MADPESLKIIKQGVEQWNSQWHSLVHDLSNADLQSQALTGANFRAINLAGASLQGCDLSDSQFQGANLVGATFCDSGRSANLQEAQLREASVRDCDLSGVLGGLQQKQLAGSEPNRRQAPRAFVQAFRGPQGAEGHPLDVR